MRGIDAPEIGARARCPAEQRLAEASRDAAAELLDARPIVLSDLGDVSIAGADLGRQLLARHLAAPWRGHHATWCP